jgi:hypothetical protein
VLDFPTVLDDAESRTGWISSGHLGLARRPFRTRFQISVKAAGTICRFMEGTLRINHMEVNQMRERSRTTVKPTSDTKDLDAAVRFVQKLGGIEQAKRALEELKKLRKTG